MKFTKVAAIAAAGLLLLGATAASAQVSAERGAYLVNGPLACGNCHTPQNADGSPNTAMFLGGGRVFDDPAFHAVAANITPDAETGIGTWTDDEIIRAIREGVTPEGQIGPPMPIFTYNHMSDDDVQSVVAYLRSLPPVHNEVEESTYNIPIALPPAAVGTPAPPTTDPVAYGGYIVNALSHCFECHTPAGADGQPDMTRMGAGGFPFAVGPVTVYSANITPDVATGLGGWTDDEIRTALTEGLSKDGTPLFPAMPAPYFHTMTADDINAVIAYLHTIPAVSNDVEKVDWMAALGIAPPPAAPAP